MKNVILIAAPAAGKGTEAVKLEEQFHIPHISTGDLLRDAVKQNTEYASIIETYQNKGEFVPFEIVLKILKNRILQPDCDNGYILDGFPRDLIQAEAYDKILKEINKDLGYVIVLDIDKEIAKTRISGRYSCPKCGRVYNINTAPRPINNGLCDVCNINLTHRDDDSADVYEQRYNTYLKKTEPLIKYYEEKCNVFHVDASITPEYTHDQVVKILGE